MVKLTDFMGYQYLSGITYSPGGGKAAFVVHGADQENNSYCGHVYLYSADGNHRRITDGGREHSFAWLDDAHILVTGKPCAETEAKIAVGEEWTAFYRVDVESGHSEPYCQVPVAAGGFAVLDGGRLALTAYRDINLPDLYSLGEAERKAEIESRKNEKGFLVLEEIPFCQNGTGYVSGRRKGLYVFDVAASELKPVTGQYDDVTDFTVEGDRLLYTTIEYRDIRTQSAGLFLYDGASGQKDELVPQGSYVFNYLGFLPGEKYVFIGWESNSFNYTNNPSIYEVSESGVRLACYPDISLTNGVSSDVRYGASRNQLVWDGKLYSITTEVTRSVIRAFSMDGEIELLHETDGAVDDFDIGDGGVLFIGQRGMRLQELYTLKNGQETCVSAFNDGRVEESALGKMHHMEFQNGGFDVHYLVLEPANMEPGKKYPAVFYIHGGAKVIFGPIFHHEMQLLSASGYYVVYGDPRGSDGRGTEFADLRGHYAEQDYDDMMKALDTALERFPQIDGERVACVGGSYGGLMTNMIITRTHRFKCAIAQRSISNLISNFSATDNGINFVANQMDATPWVNYDGLWGVSPLKYADKARTPLLLIHAELDFRCHYIEAIQMFNALKYHGVDSRMILIEGENHDLSRSGRPRQRIRRLEEILNWLDKYLKH